MEFHRGVSMNIMMNILRISMPERLGRHCRAAAGPLRRRFAEALNCGCRRGWRGEGEQRQRVGAAPAAQRRGAGRGAARRGAAPGTVAVAPGAPAPPLAGEGQRLIGLGRLP